MKFPLPQNVYGPLQAKLACSLGQGSFGRSRACQFPEADWMPLAYVAAAPDGVRVIVVGGSAYQPPAGVSSPGFSKSFVQVRPASALCMTSLGGPPRAGSVRSQATPRD